MPLTDQDRLQDDRLKPRVVALWLALQPLRSVTGFMQSGAHPDDETSAMLAALRFRDGLSTSYVCATRGEGGQNDIGRESGAALAALRTAEMERAADLLDLRLWWLSAGGDDALTDFGFSKSGVATLARWGRERTLSRFVAVLRAERPDILCPTFLDVPGQHGHHRAMTALALAAMDAAADPAYPGVIAAPWRVAKLYLPAWGGGGGAYDDETPPPPATVAVAATGEDPVTGWPYARIGQHARACHRTQGMGAWVAPGSERDWPLHLARSHVGADRAADRGAVTDNLPRTLADLGLPDAQTAAEAAIAAFPDRPRVLAAAAQALTLLHAAAVAPEHAHRLARKRAELARVLWLAAGAEARGWLTPDRLRPGARATLTLQTRAGIAEALAVTLVAPAGWRAQGDALEVANDAAPSDPFAPGFDPLAPALPALSARLQAGGVAVERPLALETPALVGAATSATLSPQKALVNLARPRAPLALRVGAAGAPTLDAPAGWAQDWDGGSGLLTPPAALAPGLYECALRVDGAPAMIETDMRHPHVPPRLLATPARLSLRALSVETPAARIGYAGCGADAVLEWLRAMGCDAHALSDAALADDAGLADCATVVVGVFAFRFRPALAAARARLRAWVERGGTLLTLYHRPWDGWDPAQTPPRPIEIGQPSLRWRVTDANAAVTHLAPDHPALTTPNPIGPQDWAGWSKERGLYFARSWDAAYAPLVAMADPGETAHRGALLSGEIGAGRHSHCALTLHHQIEALTPGAFRLLANLVTPR